GVDAGTYPARCIKVIDLGTQHGEYLGIAQIKKQVLITFELPTELMESGEWAGSPYAISKFYTASLGEKATLRHDLEAWRGRPFTEEELKGFDLKNVLGKPCMVSVIKTQTGKSKINSIMALMKGMTVPDVFNPLVYFDIDEWDSGIFAGLSDGIKKIIMESGEGKERHNNMVKETTPEGGPGEDQDIPF
ncbi:MAG: hypothetical protein AAB922_00005, partial [Patescibacteria group bacterium]